MPYIYTSNGTENRTGTADADYLYGYQENANPTDDVGDDVLDGAGGDDSVYGGGGNDTLYGGAGRDYLYGHSGNDTIDVGLDGGSAYGGEGNDTLIGSDVWDTLNGEAGSDIINAGDGDDYLIDGPYNDLSSSDTLNGGAGNDEIESYGGADKIDGGIGLDRLYLDRSSALVSLKFNFVSAAATTTLVGDGTTVTGVERFHIRTGLGHDEITTGAGDDTIYSGAGNDIISTGQGADSISAGADNDTVDAGDGNDYLYGEGGNDTLQGGLGDDTLYDGSYSDVTSIDTLNGGAGYDTLSSSGGKDTIDGGADFDVLYLDRSNATKALTFLLASTASVTTLVGDGTTVVNVERFDITLGSGNDNVTTGSGNDTIRGGDGDDTLDGGAGSDSLSGGDGNDTLILGADGSYGYGGEGNDTITGSASSDSIYGDEGSDTIDSGDGADTVRDGAYSGDITGDDIIDAGAGADSIESYGGTDQIDGGADSDILYLSRTDAVANLTFAFKSSAAVTTLVGDGTTVVNVERFYLYGGSGNDSFVTSDLADTLYGYGGNDTLAGAGGSDSLQGGIGNDVLRGGAGNDYLYGEDGNDTLDLGADGGSARGGAGNDIYIQSSPGSDYIDEYGASGIDEVQTYYTYTLLASSKGYGDFENLTLLGTAAIDGTGNEFDNVIKGNSAANTLTGLVGKDTLDGGAGADTLDGGVDNDTYIVDNAGDVVIETAGNGTADRVMARATYALAKDVDIELFTTVSASATTAINLTGNALAQEIIGNAGVNTLKDGVGAGDILRGMAGNDTYQIYSAATQVFEGSTQGSADRVMTAVSYTLAAGVYVEQLTTTSSAATTAINLTGNALAQEITGNAGVNTLRDGGGAGDVLRGLGGNDIYQVYSAATTIIESSSQGAADRVLAAVSYTLTAGAYVEQLTTTSASATTSINLTGNALAQEIIGNAGINTLKDGAGAGDVLRGMGGNDTYLVYSAATTIVESSTQGAADRALVNVDYTLGAGVHVETLATTSAAGSAAIDLTGNELAQAITGNAGSNRIDGKGGLDTLAGLGGKDMFVFSTALVAGNVDLITDFNTVDDRIELENGVFTALTTPGVLAAAAFRANTTGAAGDASDRIIYETDTGKLFYDADGTGATAGIHFATLTVGLALNNADFVVA
ncbi:beta strand repeat-containing protein [Mesorhizobium sp. ASY16-5R]|uniref:beta strand repeat-containing protein n=1 Tax=Mesorhizobium sp. ASY16-5R TaxID=3445772 RepID=UPI003F9F4946